MPRLGATGRQSQCNSAQSGLVGIDGTKADLLHRKTNGQTKQQKQNQLSKSIFPCSHDSFQSDWLFSVRIFSHNEVRHLTGRKYETNFWESFLNPESNCVLPQSKCSFGQHVPCCQAFSTDIWVQGCQEVTVFIIPISFSLSFIF